MHAASDFKFLRDRLNADLGGKSMLLANDARLVPSDPQLRCVGIVLSDSLACAPLSMALELLPQPRNLKGPKDGT